MSRTPEAISEVVDEVAKGASGGVESLCADIVNRMLEKHEYNKTRPYRHGGKVV